MKKIKAVITTAAVLLLAGGISAFVISGNQAYSAIMPKNTEATITNSENFLSVHGFSADEFNTKWSSSSERVTYISEEENNVYLDHICVEKYEYNNKTMILIPPLGYDYTIMMPEADWFLEKGFNVLIYDQRMSGGNNGATYTFGRLEAVDLKAVIDYMKTTVSQLPDIGVYTKGTGNYTSAYYLSSGYNREIDFAVFNAPYPDAYSYVYDTLEEKSFIIPKNIIESLAVSKISSRSKISFNDFDYLNYARSIDVPSLVLTQTGCSRYNSEYGDQFFDSLGSAEKTKTEFESDDYLGLFFDEPEKFDSSVSKFLSSVTS